MRKGNHGGAMSLSSAMGGAFSIAAIAGFALLCPRMGRAQGAEAGFGAVALRARVVDRQERPVSGVQVRFDARLKGSARHNGYSRQAGGIDEPIDEREIGVATTDAKGEAIFHVAPRKRATSEKWFKGRADYNIRLAEKDGESLSVGCTVADRTQEFPDTEPNADARTPKLCLFERPDADWDGFPVWYGKGGKFDRVLVVVESFDLYNDFNAADTMGLIVSAGDVLRAGGIAFLVVNFPDSHLAPDKLAPTVARAVQVAAAHSGHKVALAGLSAGGIVSRWATVTAENAGTPLPIHTFMTLDTPNRGAILNPCLEAMILHYGKQPDKVAVTSDSARALLTTTVTDIKKQVRWRTLGMPLASRQFPAECMPDTATCKAFFDRLRGLNDRRGYPKQCRIIGVANSARRGGGGDPELLHLWLPFNFFWTLKSSPDDLSTGSLLPMQYLTGFRVYLPLGIAGSYMRGAPTFIPTASALDAGPDETPPFDLWYARPDNPPARPHDDVDPGAARFVIRELLGCDWQGRERIAPASPQASGTGVVVLP